MIEMPTTRFLCPIPGCEWTHDHQGPADAPTEAVLHRHLESHGMEGMLRALVEEQEVLNAVWSLWEDYTLTDDMSEVTFMLKLGSVLNKDFLRRKTAGQSRF